MPSLLEFKGCDVCSLKKEWDFLAHPRMPIVSPKEPGPYRVVMIGEAPGENEDEQNCPFVGKSGQYLRDQIPHQWKDKLYWTNTVRCRPPKNRTPTIQEVSCCSTYLERDLEIIKPHAILAIGDVALKYFCPDFWVTGMRGLAFPVTYKSGTSWCVPSFHPSYVMRQNREDYNTNKITNSMLPVFRNDIENFFDRVPSFAEEPPVIHKPPTNEQIFYPKSEEEAISLFDRLEEPYAYDIETSKLRPYLRDARILTAAFSDGKITFAFVVNWPGNLNSWGLSAFKNIMTRHKNKKWIAQNAQFEYSWTWYTTGSWEQQFEDTEAQARLLHKRKGVGKLDILTRIYLGLDIKSLTKLDKNRLIDYPPEQVLYYNALDAWSTKILYHILDQKLTIIDRANYNRIIPTIKSTVSMELKGLQVDITESEKAQKLLITQLHDNETQARQIKEVLDYEKEEKKQFSISSGEVVGHVLVQFCGLDLPKTPKGKQYSTDEADLTPLIGKHPLVDLRLDYQEVSKLKSTYVDPILSGKILGIDGLLHPSYTTLHTATYRLSSQDPNIQNWPKRKNKEIRRQVITPEGYIFAAFDYGQLEGRVVAMFSKDPELAKAFITNDDIHWKWLYRIIDLYPQYMDRLAKVSGETEEKKILKAGRTIIKTDFVFASLYGSQAHALAKRTQIPIHITEKVLGEFWSLYAPTHKWVIGQFEKYQRTGCVSSLTGRDRNEVLPGNEVTNSPSQGSAAELVIEAQNALFFKAMNEDINYLPRINIHDDIVFCLPDSSELQQYIMTIGYEIVLPRFDFVTVPLMTEARIGTNWCDLEAVCTIQGQYFKDGVLQGTPAIIAA